jgi:hypothetical protein
MKIIMELASHVACMGEKRSAHILVGRSEGKRQLGKLTYRWGILKWVMGK